MIDDKTNLINYARDLTGIFRTVAIAPTDKPKNLLDQIVIYSHGATNRLYWYDSVNDQWNHVDATVAAGASYSPSISPSVSPSKSPSVSPS